MPLRSDSSLWFNLPGVVAAYQPVVAPDSLLARYNQAHGGTNAYRAEPGVLPAWSGATGWIANGSSYLKSGVVPRSTWSLFVRFASWNASSTEALFGVGAGGQNVWIREISGYIQFIFGSVYQRAATVINSAVAGITSQFAYVSGLVYGSMSGTPTSALEPLSIMAQDAGFTPMLSGYIMTFAAFSRRLSPAEVWTVSRQMQYCDVNPDWSAWGRRRRWYYGPQVAAGRVGIYGARPTIALPGGVAIVPQDAGGINA